MTAINLIIALFLAARCFSLNATGQKTNSEYKIAQYYGSRDKEFYYVGSILNDRMTTV